ncbi:MAG: hypothetical protein ACXVH2_06855 [Methanobacterium sp.]
MIIEMESLTDNKEFLMWSESLLELIEYFQIGHNKEDPDLELVKENYEFVVSDLFRASLELGRAFPKKEENLRIYFII